MTDSPLILNVHAENAPGCNCSKLFELCATRQLLGVSNRRANVLGERERVEWVSAPAAHVLADRRGEPLGVRLEAAAHPSRSAEQLFLHFAEHLAHQPPGSRGEHLR